MKVNPQKSAKEPGYPKTPLPLPERKISLETVTNYAKRSALAAAVVIVIGASTTGCAVRFNGGAPLSSSGLTSAAYTEVTLEGDFYVPPEEWISTAGVLIPHTEVTDEVTTPVTPGTGTGPNIKYVGEGEPDPRSIAYYELFDNLACHLGIKFYLVTDPDPPLITLTRTTASVPSSALPTRWKFLSPLKIPSATEGRRCPISLSEICRPRICTTSLRHFCSR